MDAKPVCVQSRTAFPIPIDVEPSVAAGESGLIFVVVGGLQLEMQQQPRAHNTLLAVASVSLPCSLDEAEPSLPFLKGRL